MIISCFFAIVFFKIDLLYDNGERVYFFTASLAQSSALGVTYAE